MIRFTDISAIHTPEGHTVIWSLVKRMKDIKPWQINDGGEYLVRKTANGPTLIYRAVNGKLKPTGDEFVRWGIFSDPADDIIRTPAHH